MIEPALATLIAMRPIVPARLQGFLLRALFGRNAVSQINSGRVAGADFYFLFRNACGERADVPAKLRLALPRHFQPALAARQSKSSLASRLRNGARRIVHAAIRRISAAPSANGVATYVARELRRFYWGNCRTGLYMSCYAAAHSRYVRNLADARIFGPLICSISRGGNVMWLLVRVEKPSAKCVCSAIVLDLVICDAVAAGWSFI